ncbi:MAG TPA: ferritin-like domain-containing protein [Chthoniobacterales bacterium]|jgi:ferritin-like metal-binding protein YciE
MATTRRDEVIDWLNDAYSMERGLEVMLRKQSENDDVHRAVRERARIHLDETTQHAERLTQCLQMLGSSPSTVKTMTGQMMKMGEGLMTKFARDERIKDFLAAYGSEYFEVACYKSLIAGARAAGEEEIIPLLEQNLKEDRAMADWLDMNVEGITRDYLNTTATAAA